MSSLGLLQSLLGYKAAADDDLLAALESDAGHSPSEPYRSALRLLHHISIVDEIFAAHLQGRRHAHATDWESDPPPLATLATAIRATDRWYLDHVAGLRPEALTEALAFTFTDGTAGCMTREEMLAHVVTHAGYHRGEIGRLLPSVSAVASRDVFTGHLHRREPERRLGRIPGAAAAA